MHPVPRIDRIEMFCGILFGLPAGWPSFTNVFSIRMTCIGGNLFGTVLCWTSSQVLHFAKIVPWHDSTLSSPLVSKTSRAFGAVGSIHQWAKENGRGRQWSLALKQLDRVSNTVSLRSHLIGSVVTLLLFVTPGRRSDRFRESRFSRPRASFEREVCCYRNPAQAGQKDVATPMPFFIPSGVVEYWNRKKDSAARGSAGWKRQAGGLKGWKHCFWRGSRGIMPK